MRGVVEKTVKRFKQLNGLVHSTIVLEDSSIKNMSESVFSRALEAKVETSVILREITQGMKLDFVLFYSSIQSFLGNAGQSNYVAGCTFEDAWALYWDEHSDYPVKVINWGYWGSVGIVATDEYAQRMGRLRIKSINVDEGMEAVVRLLDNRLSQMVMMKADGEGLDKVSVDLSREVRVLEDREESVMQGVKEALGEIVKI